MMKYNICIIAPSGYIHHRAFDELSQLIHYSLLEIGFDSIVQQNKAESDRRNIVLGFHLLDLKYLHQLPPNTILLNTEQIADQNGPWNNVIIHWAKYFEMWDYSPLNISRFQDLGISDVRLLRIGYQKELEKIPKAITQDIDVLFYGSINERRQKILEELRDSHLNVKSVFGVYGDERDELIARSKVVLNLHYYHSKIFEIVRIFYLLINSKAVVAEIGNGTFKDEICSAGVFAAGYNELTEACISLVKDSSLRSKQELSALNSIKKFPQKNFTEAIL